MQDNNNNNLIKINRAHAYFIFSVCGAFSDPYGVGKTNKTVSTTDAIVAVHIYILLQSVRILQKRP